MSNNKQQQSWAFRMHNIHMRYRAACKSSTTWTFRDSAQVRQQKWVCKLHRHQSIVHSTSKWNSICRTLQWRPKIWKDNNFPLHRSSSSSLSLPFSLATSELLAMDDLSPLISLTYTYSLLPLPMNCQVQQRRVHNANVVTITILLHYRLIIREMHVPLDLFCCTCSILCRVFEPINWIE